jgi:hypothetical protein
VAARHDFDRCELKRQVAKVADIVSDNQQLSTCDSRSRFGTIVDRSLAVAIHMGPSGTQQSTLIAKMLYPESLGSVRCGRTKSQFSKILRPALPAETA